MDAQSHGSGHLLLIVDDDDDCREMAAECMQIAGFDVVEAENGLDAVHEAIARTPDIILMDLEMPVMNGLEAIEALKRDPRTSAIPIVVLSANVFSDHERVERAGCSMCLSKPCSLMDLEGTLKAVLAASLAQRSSCRLLAPRVDFAAMGFPVKSS